MRPSRNNGTIRSWGGGGDADGNNSGNYCKEKPEGHLKVIQGRTLKSRAFEGHSEKKPE